MCNETQSAFMGNNVRLTTLGLRGKTSGGYSSDPSSDSSVSDNFSTMNAYC